MLPKHISAMILEFHSLTLNIYSNFISSCVNLYILPNNFLILCMITLVPDYGRHLHFSHSIEILPDLPQISQSLFFYSFLSEILVLLLMYQQTIHCYLVFIYF